MTTLDILHEIADLWTEEHSCQDAMAQTARTQRSVAPKSHLARKWSLLGIVERFASSWQQERNVRDALWLTLYSEGRTAVPLTAYHKTYGWAASYALVLRTITRLEEHDVTHP